MRQAIPPSYHINQRGLPHIGATDECILWLYIFGAGTDAGKAAHILYFVYVEFHVFEKRQRSGVSGQKAVNPTPDNERLTL